MKRNLVSLVTGCLNGEKFIPRCFNSILSQTYPFIEVIFVDDGSTDNSLQLAESFRGQFEEKGFQFKIISQKNMGFYPQSGIKISTGAYITTLDIDDLLLPESVQKRADFLNERPDFSAVRTNGYLVNENKTVPPALFESHRDTDDKTVFEDLLYAKTNNWPGTYMVRAEVLFKHYPDRILPMDRFTQNLQILLPATYRARVGFIDEPLMHYMRHDEQFTADSIDYENAREQVQSFRQVRITLLKRLNALTPEIISKLDRTYATIFLRLAYKYNRIKEFNDIFATISNPDFEELFLDASIHGKKRTLFLLRIQNKLGLRKYDLLKKFRKNIKK